MMFHVPGVKVVDQIDILESCFTWTISRHAFIYATIYLCHPLTLIQSMTGSMPRSMCMSEQAASLEAMPTIYIDANLGLVQAMLPRVKSKDAVASTRLI